MAVQLENETRHCGQEPCKNSQPCEVTVKFGLPFVRCCDKVRLSRCFTPPAGKGWLRVSYCEARYNNWIRRQICRIQPKSLQHSASSLLLQLVLKKKKWLLLSQWSKSQQCPSTKRSCGQGFGSARTLPDRVGHHGAATPSDYLRNFGISALNFLCVCSRIGRKQARGVLPC